MGYLNQPEKTAETIDAEGWLHTGDVGAIDNEGFVKITDRMKDIIITSGGKNITPSEIENQLKFSPYVSDAVVIGDKRPYLTCLVMIEQENVEKFAQDHDIPFTNYASLCRAPADPGPDPARDRGGERQFRARRDHQEIPSDRAPAHARRRGTDADHEAEAQLREQALRRRDRSDVRTSARWRRVAENRQDRSSIEKRDESASTAKSKNARPSLNVGHGEEAYYVDNRSRRWALRWARSR